MIDIKKINRLDIIEKLDIINEISDNDILLTKFISDIEAEQRRHAQIKKTIEIRNFFKLAVASIIAVILWQTFLFDNSEQINNEIQKNIEKIQIFKGGNDL